MKGLKYPSDYVILPSMVEGQAGEHSMVSLLLRNLHPMYYLRQCDALGMHLALGSVKSPHQKHQGFSSSSGFHRFLRVKGVNKAQLLEMLLASWNSGCLHFFMPAFALKMIVTKVQIRSVYSGQERA